MFKLIHVYDLDGVLIDTSHRYRNLPNGAIDLDYWITNRTREKIAQDKLLPLAHQYIKDCINPEIYTVICTSRQDHALDREYLANYLGLPDKLIMRPVDNHESDDVLKRRQLQRIFNLKQFQNLPRQFWEDNKKNIEACRDLFDSVFYVPSHITGK